QALCDSILRRNRLHAETPRPDAETDMSTSAKATLMIAVYAVLMAAAWVGVASSKGDAATGWRDGVSSDSIIAGRTVDGEIITLDDYKGQVVVVYFMATWCEVCRDKMPSIVELQNRFQNRGVQVIGISADTDVKLLRQ